MTSKPRFATFALIAPVVLALAGCGSDNGTAPTDPGTSGAVSTLQTFEIRAGTGAEATTGRLLTVRYSGWLYNEAATDRKGTQFDAGTFSFVLGARQVISGWDVGLLGMKVGGQRRLLIPASMGYGAQGNGPIPPNASLVFDVELLAVQ